MSQKLKSIILSLFLVISFIAPFPINQATNGFVIAQAAELSAAPQYQGNPYTIINDNDPAFSQTDKQSTKPFEIYSDLDSLGRCQVAYANICQEIMPTEARGDISSIHPTGWQSNMGWERCHLIGFQLAGENANAKNLITGTRYFNVTAMLPFENMIADYVKETGNHVLYRVTPYFDGSELVAKGVQMEAWSVEDNGDGICFNVFCHNVQPGKEINYATGEVTSVDLADSTITLENKTKTYTGSAIAINSAKVSGSTGSVSYTYYTDSSCTVKTSSSKNGSSAAGKAPKYAGTYYVKATVAADAAHNGATSNVAKLIIKKASSTVTLKAKSTTYTGNAITIGTASVTGSTGSKTYTYYTDSKCTIKTSASKNGSSASGKAPKYAGTYYVKATVASDKNHNSATSNAAKLTINKATQKITVATSSKSYKASTVKSGAQTFSIGAKATKGSISCSKYSGSSHLSVSSTGKVKVAKGTAAGTYTIKVKIKAASTTNYKYTSSIRTITVKVTTSSTSTTTPTSSSYVLNTNTKKFHVPSCASAAKISSANRSVYNGSRSSLISQGYSPCGNCHP